MKEKKPSYKRMPKTVLVLFLVQLLVWNCIPAPALAEVVQTVGSDVDEPVVFVGDNEESASGTANDMLSQRVDDTNAIHIEENEHSEVAPADPNASEPTNEEQFLEESEQEEVISVQSSNDDWTGDSYTVLLLDDSGSMSGSPASAQRQAAVQFLQTLLGSEGDQRVAVVRYESGAQVLSDFTGSVETAVDSLSMRSSGGTNTAGALNSADALFDGAPSNIVRNIVLCSDGLPESGNSNYSGRYTSSDYSSYSYANGAYDVASQLMQKGVHIYTLGFFHSLSGKDLEFARRFMGDIQNSGYYDVRDIGDLGLITDNIAATIAVVDETVEVSYFTPSVRKYYAKKTTKGKVTEEDIQQGVRELDNSIDELFKALKRGAEDQSVKRLQEVGIETNHTNVLKKLDETLFGFDAQMQKDNKAKDAFFKVYSEYLDTIVYDDRFMEKVDVTSSNTQIVGLNLVTSIRRTMNFSNMTRTVDGYKVDLRALSIGGAHTGSVTVQRLSDRKTYHVLSATEQEKALEILNKYVEELKEMCKDALAASLKALATEFDDALGISNWAEKSFKNWFVRIFNSGVRHLEGHGFGNIFTICDRLYGTYNEVIAPMTFAFDGDVNSVKKSLNKHAEKLCNLDLEPDNITDLFVSKALDGVKKARKSLVEMIASYLNDIDPTGVLSFELNSICCPVDVRVRDSTGAEIASVVDGVATSSGRVSVSVVGDMKTILVPLGMNVTLDIVGTGEGTMTCTTEQVIGGVPTGRANWYDIPVSEGSTFSRVLSGGRVSEDNPGLLVTEQGSIPPTEWLPFDDANSYVNVAVSSDEGGLTYGAGEYPRGEIVSVSAAPVDEFYSFDGWYNGDEFVSNSATYSFVAREDLALNARFVPVKSYDYTWSARLAEEYTSDCAMRVRKNSKGSHDIVLAMAGMESQIPSSVTLRSYASDTLQVSESTRSVVVEDDCCAIVGNVDLSNNEYVYLVSPNSKVLGVVYKAGTEVPELGEPPIASGTWGTCKWKISSAGVLSVLPGMGDDGVYDGNSYTYTYPWTAYRDKVTSVRIVENNGERVVAPSNSSFMFYLMRNMKTADLSGLDTSNVTNARRMFEKCVSMIDFNISGWDVSSVTNMEKMFLDCSSLEEIAVSAWDTSRVTNMSCMFTRCSSLKTLDVKQWNVSQVVFTDWMFEGCSSLVTLDLASWNTSSVGYTYNMFQGCTSLVSLDVSGWDTSKALWMGDMFNGCGALTTLDLSGWNTSSVTEVHRMFAGCSSLTSLDLSGWDTSSITSSGSMFEGCASLSTFKVGASYAIKSDDMMPNATSGNGKWWSVTQQAWYTRDEIISGRSCTADAYTSAELAQSARPNVVAQNYSGVYDGMAHIASVTCDYGMVYYRTDKPFAYDLELMEFLNSLRLENRIGLARTMPCIKDAGTQTVYYVVVPAVVTIYDMLKINSIRLGKTEPTGASVVFDSVTMEVSKQSALNCKVELSSRNFTYDGFAKTPSVVVSDAHRLLREGTDYTLSYENNIDPGRASVTVSYRGNYMGATVAYFTIDEAPAVLPEPIGSGWKNLPNGKKGFVRNGAWVKGWLDYNGGKYWFRPDGAMATGWTDVTDSAGKVFHYYFNPASGNLVRGTWFEIDGRKYYFRPSGNLATGWATIADNGVDKKYYFDVDGQLVTGWRDIANSQGQTVRYYFRPSGSMATGWATIDGQKYWFRDSGSMATGFAAVSDGSKRYFDQSGHMLVGWQDIGGKTFYFRDPSGAMQTGTATIGGTTYEFTASGTLKGGAVPAQSEDAVELGAQAEEDVVELS